MAVHFKPQNDIFIKGDPLEFKEGCLRVTAEGFASAADFSFDKESGVIYLPDMNTGKVYVIMI